MRTVAAEQALPSLVFSFEPTPKEYFSQGAPPARLMKFREKFQALDELGFDWFYCPRFDARLANYETDAFIDDLLVDLLGVRSLIVGDDFRFARKRSGNVNDLIRKGAERGFTVEQVGSVIENDERVSSSVVRQALAEGDLDKSPALARAQLSHVGNCGSRPVAGARIGDADRKCETES